MPWRKPPVPGTEPERPGAQDARRPEVVVKSSACRPRVVLGSSESRPKVVRASSWSRHFRPPQLLQHIDVKYFSSSKTAGVSSFVVILQEAKTCLREACFGRRRKAGVTDRLGVDKRARTGTKNNQAANEAPPFGHADRRATKSVDDLRIYDVKERGQVLEQI